MLLSFLCVACIARQQRRAVFIPDRCRNFWRAATGAELWNGNRERWTALVDRDHPIRWAWRTFDERRQRYAELRDARWVRLRSRAEMRRWLDEVAREGK